MKMEMNSSKWQEWEIPLYLNEFNHMCAAHIFIFLILTPNKMSLLSPSWSDY